MFDPGINALSILTQIIPGAVVLKDAEPSCPKNCETPIAANLVLADPGGAPISMELDFLQTGPQTWDIVIDTEAAQLKLSLGGKSMWVDDRPAPAPDIPEYAIALGVR